MMTTSILLERLARIIQNEAHVDGLKPTQWEALRFLARANRFSSNPSGLTAYLGTTKGTVSQTLAALERKGLVKKSAAANDKRTVKLTVTRAGEAALRNDPLAQLDGALSSMSKADGLSLNASLETLLRAMLLQRNGRSFGVCKSCKHFKRNAKGGAPHLCGLLNEPLSNDDGDRVCIEQSV